MTFQEKLYQLRRERSLSQEGLASALGVSRQAVQKWESGAASPDTNNLIALSDFFGGSSTRARGWRAGRACLAAVSL